MTRDELKELHYICHVANIGSILQHGILSHNEIVRRGLVHEDIAMAEIQKRRRRQIPDGRLLHDFANLYFNARNAMMFKRICDSTVGRERLVVMRVSLAVLDLPGVVLTDGNAASNWVRFMPPQDGLQQLDSGAIFARDWRDDDIISYYQKKVAVCAEVLVPDRVPVALIVGAYAISEEVIRSVRTTIGRDAGLDIGVNSDIFFAQIGT